MQIRVNLLDFDLASLKEFLIMHGEKKFRATQIFQWIHQRGIDNIEEMNNLGKSLQKKLAQHTSIILPKILMEKKSQDGTYKWVLQLADNNCIETVFIPEDDRGTLCVSSQVGCALNCSFCSTGHQGFNRNLTVAEIIGQLWIAVRRLSLYDKMHDRRITNVVMMGMGEPLLNFDNVIKAMSIMRDDFGYGLSKRRVTLSTSGVVPLLEKLKLVSDVSLAVSLHAPTDELRDILVPINKKYPLKELLNACKAYFPTESRRKITFEYVMLDGINDTPQHAKQLIKILQGVPAKVNLIPFNIFPKTIYKCSSSEAINKFQTILMDAGLITTKRRTRGDDIDAACGQLVGQVHDKTKRQQQYQRKIPLHSIAVQSVDR